MRWKSGGLCFYTSYADLLFNIEANNSLADFVRAKIRPRINDPEIARKLIPSNYPILTKRLCADTNFYETFNRDNVTLVDVREVPISEITVRGVKVGDYEHELDTIIFATGFDAVTGVLVNMDIRGRNGKTIREAWSDGPRTQAGLMTTGFPNMFMVNGPGSCTAFFNPILNVEYQGELFARMIELMRERGFTSVDSTIEADEAWAKHMAEVAAPTLFWQSDNWFIGANIPGKPRVMMLYLGGFQAYKQFTTKLANDNFPTFSFAKAGEAASINPPPFAGRV